MSKSNLTRRDALKLTGLAIAAPTIVPASALGRDGQAPPSETVRVGLIGCGGRAPLVLEGKDVPGFQVVAVADCHKERADNFSNHHSGGKWPAYEDFRQMIDAEQLDGVMVETTTHARAWITIHAMQMGMDAYVEKPIALTISEGRAMVNAARALGRVTQVGTQQRSMPINNWASDLVKNGAIGKIKTVLAPNFIGPYEWTGAAAVEPGAKVDPWWDVWTNQAPLRPYDAQLHLGWARWRAYDSGGMCFGVSGWGAHSYDQILRAIGADETGPVEVLLEEEVAVRDSGRFAPQETVGGVAIGATGDIDTGVDYYSLARLAGPRAKVRMTMANGTELRMHLDGDRGPGLGAIFIGENGKIEINRNKVASNPKELVRGDDNPGRNTRPESSYHIENWVNCIKTRERCNADIEHGQRANSLCELVNIARHVGRVGEPLAWDPDAERFTNSEEANAMLSRPRRAGWELPEVG